MDFTVQQIARVAHETNESYCHSIRDHSQPSWDDAPLWQRESAIKGVLFHLEQHGNRVTPSPATSHECWLKEKHAAGWKYGPVKDSDKKEHPCFVPYEKLPVEQRVKDYLFGAVVAAFFRAGTILPQ